MSVGTDRFEPRIIGFLCNWCSYAGADKAGAAQISSPPNVSIIRVMCSGRVDPQFVLAAFQKGADGVLILGCHPGDCHYKEGNYRAASRHALLLSLLSQLGIPPERCRFDYVSASEGERFVRIIAETVSAVRSLGPFRTPADDLSTAETNGTEVDCSSTPLIRTKQAPDHQSAGRK